MSYTTRCPACGTTFRVVPDQLKISDGWVRCGHCADVFDATLYLEAWTPPPVPAEPVAEPQTLADTSAAPTGAALSVPERALASTPDAPLQPPTVTTGPEPEPPAQTVVESPVRPLASGVEVPAGGPASVAMDEWLTGPDLVQEPEARWTEDGTKHHPVEQAVTAVTDASPAVSAPPAALAPEDFQAELARFAAASGRLPPEPDPVPPPASDSGREAPMEVPVEPEVVEPEAALSPHEGGEPGFMRQARRQAFWRAPAVRALLLLTGLLLSLLLAGQWAVHERDRLAASHPDLAPLLARLCEPLDCRIAPLRHIEAVVIDSATLARRLGNFYAFDVVVRNTADLPVAMPALELSLTDTRDQVIARRVFLPAELPDAPTLLPAQDSVPLSLRLSITDVGAMSMAGYRALVFYP